MAGGKETGRQKMIGMMYLVLTALLAMNVSKDILDAFVIVNGSLEQTNASFGRKNDKTYQDFEAAKAKDPAKTEAYYQKALQAKKLSADLTKYIDSMKKYLIEKTDKKPKEVADTLKLKNVDSKDNYDVPTYELIGDDAANPKDGEFTAKELKKKINDTRNAFVKIFDDEKLFLPSVKKEIEGKIGLQTPDFGMNNGVNETWETGNFYHLPLAAVITNLSKMQADVKNAEADVINTLLAAVKGKDFTFDKLVAKVIAPSSYILSGDEYKADVLLVAFNSTTSPKIILGDVDTTKGEGQNPLRGAGDSTSVKVEGGTGKYVKQTGGEGLQKWSGVIKVEKPGGGYNYYPFVQEYMVAKPAIAVSPTKMNVFYMGVENPVDVSAAGVAPENLVVNLAGNGSISGSKGKYIVKVSGGTEATVNVSAKFGSQTKSMGAGMKFRVKRLPDPYAFVGGKRGDFSIRKSELLASGGVQAKMENFDFEMPLSVSSFDLTANIKGDLKTISTTGNKFTPEMLKLLQTLGGGSKVYVENVKCRMPDGTTRPLGSCNMKLTL